MSNWQLPEGIDELTGNHANAFESARRDLLDLYQSWGYDIVVPPMIEYVDNLVLNSKSVDDKTFKFLDCLLYTSPSPRDATLSRMPSSA